MPIYAYRCAACGAEKDVLQKFSDAPLTICPACQAASFQRVLTAPAFQLKGSGWYVTDFRDGNKAKAKPSGTGDAAADKGEKPGEAGAPAKAGETKPAESKPAESSTPAAGGTANTGTA